MSSRKRSPSRTGRAGGRACGYARSAGSHCRSRATRSARVRRQLRPWQTPMPIRVAPLRALILVNPRPSPSRSWSRRHLLAATHDGLRREEREEIGRRRIQRLDSHPEARQPRQPSPQATAHGRRFGGRASPQSRGGEESAQPPLQDRRLRTSDPRAVARGEDAGHAGLQIRGAPRDPAAARGTPLMRAAEQARQLGGGREPEAHHDGVDLDRAAPCPVHAPGAVDRCNERLADLVASAGLDHRLSPSQRDPRPREPSR